MGYPDYKIQWGRFPLAAEWLKECTECTDGVMLSDVRDAYFQRDPFAAVTHEQAASGLMLFEEHPMMTTKSAIVSLPFIQTSRLFMSLTHLRIAVLQIYPDDFLP